MIHELGLSVLVAYGVGALVFIMSQRGEYAYRWRAKLMRLFPQRVCDATFLGLILVYLVSFTTLTFLKHESFHTGLLLGIYVNDLWHILAGQPFVNSLVDSTDLWNNYFDPLLLALAPLYAIAPDGRILLFSQTLAMGFAAFPIYWFARRDLGAGLALVFGVSFLLSPAVHYVNLDDFNIVSLSTPIISLALYFLLRQRFAPFLVTVLLAVMVKEEISLVVIGLGVFVFLFSRKYLGGMALSLFGFGSLYVILNYLTPLLTGKPYFQGRGYFGRYGGSVVEILRTLISQPSVGLPVISAPPKIEFLAGLFLPLALVPLAGAPLLITSLPALVGLLLTDPNLASLETHYPASIIPSLYFAAILGARWLIGQAQRWERHPSGRLSFSAQVALSCLLLVSAAASYYLIGPAPLAKNYAADRYLVDAQSRSGHNLLSQIPPQAVVAAQEELIAQLANREHAFVFPQVSDYRLADYVVMQRGRFFFNFHRATFERWMSTGFFQILAEADGFILAKRKSPDRPANLTFGDNLVLEGFALASAKGTKDLATLYLTTQWHATSPIPSRYKMLVQVVDAEGHIWASVAQEPLGGLAPTTQWQPGKTLADQYAVALPPTIPSGVYQLTIAVHRPAADEGLQIRDESGRPVGVEFALTHTRIEKNKSSFAVSELRVEQRLFADLRELRLLGFVPPRETIAPGDLFQIGIYWRARTQPQTNYRVAIQLRDSNGRVAAEHESEPAKGSYPTTLWSPGEVLLDWHDWWMPPILARGNYQIYLVLRDASAGIEVGQIMLSPIAVIQ